MPDDPKYRSIAHLKDPTDTPTALADFRRLTELLESIPRDSHFFSSMPLEDQIRFKKAAGQAVYPDKHLIIQRNKKNLRARSAAKRQADRAVRATTEIRNTRAQSVFIAPPTRLLQHAESTAANDIAGQVQTPRFCYICKAEYTDIHFFYDSMCVPCARFNYTKRSQTARLDGRVAVITGARLKIGYQAALMMLRAGARVIVTTRFPQDSALRYARENDFKEWRHRLQIHGLDLRHSPSVETFTRFLNQKLDRLDILINNAAQTVRRPPQFYAHMLETESLPLNDLPADAQSLLQAHEECKLAFTGEVGTKWLSEWHANEPHPAMGIVDSAKLSQIPYRCDESLDAQKLFPTGKLDADLQQIDMRELNSWRMTLAQVPTAELLEVQLVNSIAPFILCSKLKPLMMRDRTDQKHIVNVSAMEGKFNRFTKTDKHPHTNMAKAALNMMTLTSAREYAQDGIFMNAVDTGWVTDEDPLSLSLRKQDEHDFHPPLDIVDGAARVCDPFFAGLITGQHSFGNFLKDYFPTAW